MRFAELDAVTVDGYGTLLTLANPVSKLRRALAKRGFERTASEVERAFAAEASYYRPRSHLGHDEVSLFELRRDCVAVFLEAVDANLDPASFVTPYITALEFTALPGAVGTLEKLTGQGLRLAVVSNWDCSLPLHLSRLDLDRLFSTVVTSADVGRPKPDPAPFRLALERLDVQPERALHVGDESEDEEGARAAGMRFAPAPLTAAFESWT
jgi:HAD superfamily hydrolase (TIGR01509 family)